MELLFLLREILCVFWTISVLDKEEQRLLSIHKAMLTLTVNAKVSTINQLYKQFLAGLRYFLAQGYAVIFLHRGSSLKPFQRHYASENPLDWLCLSDGRVQGWCCSIYIILMYTELLFSLITVSTFATEYLENKISKILPRYTEVCNYFT